jgi:hypothetical protein
VNLKTAKALGLTMPHSVYYFPFEAGGGRGDSRRAFPTGSPRRRPLKQRVRRQLRIAFSNAERSVANGTQIDAACQKRRLGVSAMERGPFERGYVAGWQYVRGSEDVPANAPQSPMRIAAEAYKAGFSRGVKDATD